jgi:hypothetical protein
LLEINFLGVVPESRFSSRNSLGASIPSHSTESGGAGATRGQLRLRVLRSLPDSHQWYLLGEIRKLCCDYLRINRIPVSELSTEELLSETWQKLLGTVSLPKDEGSAFDQAIPIDWSVNPHTPEFDGRVVWLIREIGGSVAMAHRRADVLRSRFGRGRTTVQIGDDDESFEIGPNQDEDSTLRAGDARRVWVGLLAVASHEFGPEEDVAKLLRMLAQVPDIFDESSGTQWPVGRLVVLLNDHFPPPDWKDRRVEDAKRRLTNWIKRLMQKNALDAIDLEAIFARVARQQQRGDRDARRKVRPHDLQS